MITRVEYKEYVKHYVECICRNQEDMMVINVDKNNGCPPELWIRFQNTICGIFIRLSLGIKYILGLDSKYSCWGEILITPDDVNDIIKILEDYKNELKSI